MCDPASRFSLNRYEIVDDLCGRAQTKWSDLLWEDDDVSLWDSGEEVTPSIPWVVGENDEGGSIPKLRAYVVGSTENHPSPGWRVGLKCTENVLDGPTDTTEFDPSCIKDDASTYNGCVRVVQASKAYRPHVGGIETVVEQLAEGFHSRKVTSTVVVASDDRHSQTEVLNGVQVVRSATYARVRSVPLSPLFPAKLLSQRADALLIHEPSVLPELVFAAGQRAVRRRFPVVALWWHSDIVRQKLLLKAFGPVLRRALSLVDVIFAATPAHVSSSPMLQEFADKVITVPYGLDLRRFDDDVRVIQRAAEWRERIPGKIVVTVARLVYYKGIEQLMEAADQIPDAHFVIIGKGDLADRVDTSLAMSQGRVTRIPFADDLELRAILKAADVFVLPSIANTEAFGIVQTEAMASGTPVVTFDLPTGVTWVNRHEVTGLVAPLATPGSLREAIVRLLADDALRLRLGTKAEEHARHQFDQETMIDTVLHELSRSNP